VSPDRPFRVADRQYRIWYNRPIAWTVETLNETVDAELAELPADMRARLVRISELIESVACPTSRSRTSATSAGRSGRFV
jgi:hypothetical protein